MPGKCYREENGVQRKGVRATRKNGKGYCKLVRKTDKGERVGIRYGKVVYTSVRGSLFYYNTNGNKTYLRPKQISETVLFDAPSRKHTNTSTYLRNNEAPVVHGHYDKPTRKVTASNVVVNTTQKKKTKKKKDPNREIDLEDHPADAGITAKSLGQNLFNTYAKGLPPPPEIDESVFEQKRIEAEKRKEKRKYVSKKGKVKYKNGKNFDRVGVEGVKYDRMS